MTDPSPDDPSPQPPEPDDEPANDDDPDGPFRFESWTEIKRKAARRLSGRRTPEATEETYGCIWLGCEGCGCELILLAGAVWAAGRWLMGWW